LKSFIEEKDTQYRRIDVKEVLRLISQSDQSVQRKRKRTRADDDNESDSDNQISVAFIYQVKQKKLEKVFNAA